MKTFFANIWKYIAVFFAGIIAALVYAMNQIKPDQKIVNADSYVENQDQKIGKLKQRGEGNTQDVEISAQTKREQRRQRRRERKNKTVLSDQEQKEEI